MNRFSFTFPTNAVYGRGQLERLSRLKLPGKKALLVTTNGTSMEANGYLARVEAQLTRANVELERFSGISPNPLLSEITAGAAAARESGCDFVLGLGGGSAIDGAKAIALMAVNPGSLWDYSLAAGGGYQPFPNKPLPVVAIPTTAGTGSEVDAWAVVTNEATLEKTGIGMPPYSCPVLAVIDPSLTDSVPPRLTAYQGFDALFHATESVINLAQNPVGKLFAMKAIELLARALPAAVRDGGNRPARDDVALAASLAGYVMLCTAEHSIEHAMSAVHHELPHGAGLIMISRAYYKKVAECGACDAALAEMARSMGRPEASCAGDFLDALAELQEKCGVADLKMSDYGFTREELAGLPALARAAMGSQFASDPAGLSDQDVLNILTDSYR